MCELIFLLFLCDPDYFFSNTLLEVLPDPDLSFASEQDFRVATCLKFLDLPQGTHIPDFMRVAQRA